MRTKRRMLLALGVLVAVAGMVLGAGAVARGRGTSAFDRAHSNFTPEQARAFTDFPLYWLGESFEGEPLTAMHRRLAKSPVAPGGVNYVSFKYGTCEPEPERGCAPPLELQLAPICERNPSRYGLAPAPPDGSGTVPLPHEPLTIRDVPAALFGDGRLEVYAGRATVVVFGSSRAQVVRAAEKLSAVNAAATAAARPGGLLPRPPAGALEGRSC